jgi:tetratricopeptide (TPR) repeat protein
VYLLVLLGSLIGLCAFLGVRLALRYRTVRKFVRGIKKRADSAAERGFNAVEDIPVDRPDGNSRATARQLQEVRSLIRKAERAQAQGQTEEMERLYIQALTIDPAAYEVRAELAKLYLTTDRELKAAALYRELLDKQEDVSYWSNLGLAYYRLEQYEDACDAYKQALSRDPANPDRCYALGRACIAAGRLRDAAPLLEKASARLSRDIDLLRMLAECYVSLGQIDRAEEVYRRINRLQPYDEDVKAKLAALANA